MDDMLCGRLKPSNKYKVSSLEACLKKFFPTADFIVLSDSDDDPESLLREIEVSNENVIKDEISECLLQDYDSCSYEAFQLLLKQIPEENICRPKKAKFRRPSVYVPSIAEYSMKTQKLPPASAYAKRSKIFKPALSLNYKNAKPFVKPPYDPKEETIKLNNVKERIYCKQFLKISNEKKEIKDELKQETENVKLEESLSEVKLEIKLPLKIRKRSKSMYNEIIDLSENDD
jgi:hypothetical protein